MTIVFIAEAVPSPNKGKVVILRGLVSSLQPMGSVTLHLLSY
jgi:hypothetical protein